MTLIPMDKMILNFKTTMVILRISTQTTKNHFSLINQLYNNIF